MHHNIIFIIIILFSQSVFSQITYDWKFPISENEYETNDINLLSKRAFTALHQAEFEKAIRHGEKIFSLSLTNMNQKDMLTSQICLGQAYLMQFKKELAYSHLTNARILGEELKNDSALASVFNGFGLYALNLETDYYRSLSYFFKGLEYAKNSNNEALESIILANISVVYYIKNDTTGLQYAQACYDLGHKKQDIHLIFIGSINSAHMYYLMGQYDIAMDYAKEAEFLNEKNKYRDKGKLYSLCGNLNLALNKKKESLEYFNKALDSDLNDFPSSKLSIYLGMCNYHLSENNYNEAITWLENGLHLSRSLPHAIDRCTMLEKISDIYEIRKDYEKALSYRKELEAQKDSLIKHDNDLMIGDLHVKYETQIKETELAGLQIKMKEKENRLKFLILIICILIALSLFVLFMYRRKNILYLTIVKQRKNSIKQEDILRAQIKELTDIIDKNTTSSDRYASSLTSEKSNHLFNKLEKLMREDKFFLDVDLTRDKIAEALNTNRTYLSQIINEKTELNFSQYINNYRIEEAVRILSDQNNEMPLKAVCNHVGFRSMTTFYNLFQTSIGLTPAQFRTKNMIIETEEQSLKNQEELL